MLDLVGNPEDQFSHNEAHLNQKIQLFLVILLSKVLMLSYRTDKSGQTVQTQIRLLLEGPGSSLFAILFASV